MGGDDETTDATVRARIGKGLVMGLAGFVMAMMTVSKNDGSQCADSDGFDYQMCLEEHDHCSFLVDECVETPDDAACYCQAVVDHVIAPASVKVGLWGVLIMGAIMVKCCCVEKMEQYLVVGFGFVNVIANFVAAAWFYSELVGEDCEDCLGNVEVTKVSNALVITTAVEACIDIILLTVSCVCCCCCGSSAVGTA